jgi:hypothetical protein
MALDPTSLGHALCLLALCAAILFLYGDLLDTVAFASHEGLDPVLRTQQMVKEVAAGNVPPRVLPDAIYGAGHAFPQFYTPFAYLVSAALAALYADPVVGVNLAFLLSAVASGLAMYFMGVTLTGDRLIALAAALVYVSVPYRLVDVFVRGALAESWSFAWYPLVIAGVWSAVARRSPPWYLPVSLAGLVLTHSISALYFMGFFALLVPLAWWWSGPRAGAAVVAAGALGVGLALWFVLPQYAYLPQVLASEPAYIIADEAWVHAHRVLPWQLFRSSEEAWWGGSQDVDLGHPDGMSFELGAGQFLAPLLVVALALGRSRLRGEADARLAIFAGAAMLAWLASVAFMLSPSPFLSLLPAQFSYIQFPWRMLGFAAFFSSAAIAAAAACLRLSRFLRGTLVGIAAALLLAIPAYQREKAPIPEVTAETITDELVWEQGAAGFTGHAEYVPKEVLALGRSALAAGPAPDDDFSRVRKADLVRMFRALLLDSGFVARPRVAGEAAVSGWRRTPSGAEADVDALSESRIVFPVFYYDFYRVTGGDAGDLETFSADGFLGAVVPPGARTLTIGRRMTWPFGLGLLASALSAAAVAWLAWRDRQHLTPGRGSAEA